MDTEQSVYRVIRVSGIVQGVGLRPFIFHLAKKHGIKGTVRNLGGLVEIKTQSGEGAFRSFLRELERAGLTGAKITRLEVEDALENDFDGFRILPSEDLDRIKTVPADLPYCKECEKDLKRKGDRRYRNPFVSCMSCGPRYSMIKSLPYDRENTTMDDFPLCEKCAKDYQDPADRRFYAQTVSCNDCGPYLICRTKEGKFTGKDALSETVKIINNGGIAAVKGVGGFHFSCLAFDNKAAANLRKLKGREEKPFAVMFGTLKEIRNHCAVSKEEERLLKSDARPIVLLDLKEKTEQKIPFQVGRGSVSCGAFLPYAPVQKLLAEKCGPLIMTSANLSGEPVIKDNEVILGIDSPYIDCFLYHDRRILRSLDDSVVRVLGKNTQIIRRSRGYAPQPVMISHSGKEKAVFAAGGDLKSAFCLYKNHHAFLSQYFGDLEEEKTFQVYKESISDLERLLHIKPDLIVCDLHPYYFSSQHAKTLGENILFCQHHHAHIASVMAEHNIAGKVIGVAFDGTGFGTDQAVWGGEFLICEKDQMKRAGHLSYTPVLGGDSLSRDAQKTALCFLLHAGLFEEIKDQDKELVKAALDHHVNTVLTSSMGRLFDAVSAVLEVEKWNAYEGKCAAELEKEALVALKNKVKPCKLKFTLEDDGDMIRLNPNRLLKKICAAKGSTDKGALALGFHLAVSDAVIRICKRLREKELCNRVALSGGVFQNKMLTEDLLKKLKKNQFEVYVNKEVPPNDGGISLGQAYIGLLKE